MFILQSGSSVNAFGPGNFKNGTDGDWDAITEAPVMKGIPQSIVASIGTFLGPTSLPASLQGGGTRFLWYPEKAAFRAGRVTSTDWDDINIGNYSVAFGLNNIALSEGSFVAGRDSDALDIYDTVFGRAIQIFSGTRYAFSAGLTNLIGQTTVSDYSVAIGNALVIDGLGNAVFGRTNTLSPGIDGCLVGGQSNTITGDFALLSGQSNVIQSGNFNFVHGQFNEVDGQFNSTSGFNNDITGAGNVVFGNGNLITESDTVVLGFGNTTDTAFSVLIGEGNSINLPALSLASWIVGDSNQVNGTTSFAIGRANFVGSTQSGALGNANFINASQGFVMADRAVVDGDRHIVFGQLNDVDGSVNSVFGTNQIVAGSRNFVTGFNNDVQGDHNSVFGDNHTVGIGINRTITLGSNVTPDGSTAIFIGTNQIDIKISKPEDSYFYRVPGRNVGFHTSAPARDVHFASEVQMDDVLYDGLTSIASDDFVLTTQPTSSRVEWKEAAALPGVMASEASGASEGVSSTASGTYVQKLKLTFTPAVAGNYLIQWSMELGNSGTDTQRARVQLDDTTDLAESTTTISVAGEYEAISGFQIINLTAVPHDIDIDYLRVGATGNAQIRRARISVLKI